MHVDMLNCGHGHQMRDNVNSICITSCSKHIKLIIKGLTKANTNVGCIINNTIFCVCATTIFHVYTFVHPTLTNHWVHTYKYTGSCACNSRETITPRHGTLSIVVDILRHGHVRLPLVQNTLPSMV